MLTAYQFSYLVESEAKSGVHFGVDRKKVSESLRALADAVESGTFIVQEGTVITDAVTESYPMTRLYLKFHERDTGKLHGTDGDSPAPETSRA